MQALGVKEIIHNQLMHSDVIDIRFELDLFAYPKQFEYVAFSSKELGTSCKLDYGHC